MRRVAIALCALTLIAGSQGTGVSAEETPGKKPNCVKDYRHYRGVGRACETAEGFLQPAVLPAGQVVHPESDQLVPAGTADMDSVAFERGAPQCVTSGHKIEIVYAVPQDRPNTYWSWAQWLRDQTIWMDAALNGSDPDNDQHLRVLCHGGTIAVHNVTMLPVGSDNQFTFNDYVTSMTNQIALGLGPRDYEDPDTRYLTTLFHGAGVGSDCGRAVMVLDSRRDTENGNNRGTRYALVGEGCKGWPVMMHELGHALGAVQLDAPHSSGGMHCFEVADLMCYNDGGPYFSAGGPMVERCWGFVGFDCGDDDYYSTKPQGTYLQTHWNIAHSNFLTNPRLIPHPPLVDASASDNVWATSGLWNQLPYDASTQDPRYPPEMPQSWSWSWVECEITDPFSGEKRQADCPALAEAYGTQFPRRDEHSCSCRYRWHVPGPWWAAEWWHGSWSFNGTLALTVVDNDGETATDRTVVSAY